MKNYNNALTDLLRLRESTNYRSKEVTLAIAECHYEMHNNSEAINYFQQALPSIDINDEKAIGRERVGYYYYCLAETQIEQLEFQDAVFSLEKVLEYNSQMLDALRVKRSIQFIIENPRLLDIMKMDKNKFTDYFQTILARAELVSETFSFDTEKPGIIRIIAGSKGDASRRYVMLFNNSLTAFTEHDLISFKNLTQKFNVPYIIIFALSYNDDLKKVIAHNFPRDFIFCDCEATLEMILKPYNFYHRIG